MKLFAGLAILLVSQISCQAPSTPIRIDNTAMLNHYDSFIRKAKFQTSATIAYDNGDGKPIFSILNERINLAALDFQNAARHGVTSDKEYLRVIRTGLDRFRELQIDTEEREQVCSYFEELMDIAGIEGSDGLLNEYMYGFDVQ